MVKQSMRQGLRWLEYRTGFGNAVQSFCNEEVPAATGWAQAFGSVALFLCLIQAVTGILLAFNYAGTPGDAYNSLTYIIREVPMGRMIHGLHHWGASLMLIAVVVHMAQVFLYGAYRRPREVTWICGVFLLLVTLGFALTGYLLPWDNRAYWGTVVTTQIIGQAPFLGTYIREMLGANDGIGVVTFARFYSLHVLILPATTMLLIAVHLRLVRRHGVTGQADDNRPKHRFYPAQAFRDVVACFVAFVLLFAGAALLRVPLERLADPTDASYVPRPEWYFLFLFESLKLFKGSLEPIGSIGLPTAAVLGLFALPFIDRAQASRVRQRTVAIAVLGLAVSTWAALTAAALRSSPPSGVASAVHETPSGALQLSAEEMAGLGYFRREHCQSCHNLVDGMPKPGPTLAVERPRRSASWMIEHFKNPSQMIPGSNMPPIPLPVVELNALSAFLLKLTAEVAMSVDQIPSDLVEGAHVYVANHCGSCHKVNGVGGNSGPSLNGLAQRRSKEWIEKHFESPQKLSPGTIMPPFHFPQAQREALITYLNSLP